MKHKKPIELTRRNLLKSALVLGGGAAAMGGLPSLAPLANAQMQHVVEHYRRMHQQQNRDSWCAFGLKVCIVMLALMLCMRWAIVSYAVPSLAEPLKEMQRAMNQSQLALGETQMALKELQNRPQANAQVNCGGPSYPLYQPYY